jgi:hypothetical protein
MGAFIQSVFPLQNQLKQKDLQMVGHISVIVIVSASVEFSAVFVN